MNQGTYSEVRAFLGALIGQGSHARRWPPELLHCAKQMVRGDLQASQDLVADTLLDLLERRNQAGSIEALLRLKTGAELRTALRWRMVQVRARQFGSKSLVMKRLRWHVRVALQEGVGAVDAFPETLMVKEHLCQDHVGQAVSAVLAQRDPPPRHVRAISAYLWTAYFEQRLRQFLETRCDSAARLDDLVIGRADTARHALQLGLLLGPELLRVLCLRIQGRTLKQVGEGRLSVSTVCERQREAVHRVRQHVQRHGLLREELELLWTLWAA